MLAHYRHILATHKTTQGGIFITIAFKTKNDDIDDLIHLSNNFSECFNNYFYRATRHIFQLYLNEMDLIYLNSNKYSWFEM